MRPVERKERGSANYGYEAWEDQLGGGCSLEEMLCKWPSSDALCTSFWFKKLSQNKGIVNWYLDQFCRVFLIKTFIRIKWAHVSVKSKQVQKEFAFYFPFYASNAV